MVSFFVHIVLYVSGAHPQDVTTRHAEVLEQPTLTVIHIPIGTNCEPVLALAPALHIVEVVVLSLINDPWDQLSCSVEL
jgi:hypothetical protein